MQEVRKSPNQNLRADPAWGINSGKMESSPKYFSGFRCLRAAASSSGLMRPEILFLSRFGIFHRSDSFLMIILEDLWPSGPVCPAPHKLRGDAVC